MCKVSVIIPIYNASECLQKTLNNVRHQTLKDIEIICVNDGSSDNSESVIKEIQNKDCRIKYEYQKNQGAGVARNRGMKIARGEYIAFMDADDLYPNETVLEALYNAAKKNEALICGGSLKKLNLERENNNDKRCFNKEGYVKFIDYQFDLLFARFIFKHAFITENNIEFPTLRVYEDPIFLCNALYLAKQFYAIKEEVYLYNGSHQINEMSFEKVENYLQGIIEELKFTSENKLAQLHSLVLERLEHQASYCAEKYLYENEIKILELLLKANEVIDRELIGLEKNYILKSIKTLFDAGNKYMKIRNIKIIRVIRHLFNK